MSYADKFARKADEIKGRAKAALGEALDDNDLREQGRAEVAHALASRADHAPGQATAPSADGPEPSRPNTHDVAPATTSGTTGHQGPEVTSPDTVTRNTPLASDSATTGSPVAADARREPTNSPAHGVATEASSERTSSLAAPTPTRQAAAAPERLLPEERRHDYVARWSALKGEFVDDPRQTIAQADRLVAEVLNELAAVFAEQRRQLESGLNSDQATTEDLRVAFRRYREFFDRLLSL